jgi:hypothetical protein
MLFQLHLALTYFPVGGYVSRFDGKVASLLCLASFFKVGDLERQLTSALLIGLDLLFELTILFPQTD